MILFVIVALCALIGAVGVVIAREPVHSALFLILNIIALAVFYIVLSAEFLAAAQVIVYAGAIMVLFLFVVTLLTAGKEDQQRSESLKGQRLAAGVLAVLAGGGLAIVAVFNPSRPGLLPLALPRNFGNLSGMGAILWGPDFVYLAAVALMLLTAAVGVMVLNRPRPAPEANPKVREREL